MIDTHSHLFLEDFDEDRPEVISRAREAGVTHIFLPNIDRTTVKPLLDLCETFPGYCFPMIGLHPTSVHADYEEELQVVEKELVASKAYVAIGEIGLDLYWDKTYEREQQQALKQQLDWALAYDLPVVLHCREAFGLMLEILEPYRTTSLRGIFHSFTGNRDEAERLLQFSRFLIGINGVVTFKKSTLPEVLPLIPLERLVLETDAPYLTPAPNRGKRNESAFIKYTLMKVAEVYGRTSEEVSEVTSKTALKMFGMLK